MMNLWMCLNCKAVYTEIGPDGLLLFHACPLVVDPDAGRLVKSPGHRDENIDLDRRGRAIGIRSEGLGVNPVKPNKLPEPQWLTNLKAKLEEEE